MAVSAAYWGGREKDSILMQLVTRRCLNGLGRRKIDFHSFGGGKRGEATIFFKVAGPFVHGFARQRSERCPRTKRD